MKNDLIVKGDNWVNLCNLPRYNGENRLIKWNDCAGLDIEYFYNNKKGIIHIKRILENGFIIISLNSNNKELKVRHDTITRCMLSYILEEKSYDYLYNVGDKIKVKQGYLVIRSQKRIKMSKKTKYTQRGYEVECSKCHHIFDRTEYQINKNNDIICPVCLGREVKVGYNDIATTDPWVINYLVNKEDSKKYTRGCNSLVQVKCPLCKKEKTIIIQKLIKDGIGCCSDGISYGEKFLMKLFDLYNIDYIYQLTKKDFDWCKNYRYDFYLPKYNWIIEVMGGQHYSQTNKFGDLKDIQNNDRQKKKLALNYMDNYIELDVHLSKLEIIKDSIKNSDINNIIDIDNIDFDFLHYHSTINSLIQSICEEHKNNPTISTKELSKKYKVSQRTVGVYLKFGNKYGLCEYDTESRSKPIKIILNDKTYVFRTLTLLYDFLSNVLKIHFTQKNLQKYIDTNKMYKNMYIYRISKKEFNTYYKNNNNDIFVYGDIYSKVVV